MQPNVANTIFFLIINLLILLYSFWLNKRYYKSYVYISLPFLFTFFMFLFHICVHTYMFFSDNFAKYYADNVDSIYITKAFIFATLFNVFFNLGGSINLFIKEGKHRVFTKFIKSFNKQTLLKYGLIVFLVGVLSKFIFFIAMGNGNIFYYVSNYFSIQLEKGSVGDSFFNYLSFLWVCIEIGTDLLLINTLKNNSHRKLTIGAILIGILFMFNSRLAIIKMLLQYLIILAIYNKKVRINLPIYFVSIFLPIILIILIGIGIFRESTNNKVLNNIDYTYFVVGSIHPMKTLCDGLEHQSSFGKLRYGKNIILPIIQKPIPRKVWKNKALNAAAIWTNTMKPGALEAGFAVAPGIGFDLLINFGYAGTLLCFLIFGFILFRFQALLYNSLLYNFNNEIIILIMAILCSTLLNLRGADISSIVSIIAYYIPALFIIFVNTKIKI